MSPERTSTGRANAGGARRASRGFPPLAAAGCRVLILGSLPGQMSLARTQYYAQPQNAFWKIMGALYGAGPDLPYAERAQRLIARGVAVWDVCASARRVGSLDAAIEPASVVPNAFARFHAAHPALEAIYFNGARAAELYRRLVLPGLSGRAAELPRETLPSTSPAHASLNFARKLERWSVIVR